MTKTPKLHDSNELRKHLLENDWTPHEVRDCFHWVHEQGMTLHARTDGDWEDLIDKHLGR